MHVNTEYEQGTWVRTSVLQSYCSVNAMVCSCLWLCCSLIKHLVNSILRLHILTMSVRGGMHRYRGHVEWGVPLLMRERLKDPHAFAVSLRASEEICCLLRSESLKLKCLCWQRTNGIFPLRKRCRIVLACSKCQRKNVCCSTPLMKHAHEIKACILLPMFRFYMYKEVGRGGGKRERWGKIQEVSEQRERCRSSLVYRYVFCTLEVRVNWIFMSEYE